MIILFLYRFSVKTGHFSALLSHVAELWLGIIRRTTPDTPTASLIRRQTVSDWHQVFCSNLLRISLVLCLALFPWPPQDHQRHWLRFTIQAQNKSSATTMNANYTHFDAPITFLTFVPDLSSKQNETCRTDCQAEIFFLFLFFFISFFAFTYSG